MMNYGVISVGQNVIQTLAIIVVEIHVLVTSVQIEVVIEDELVVLIVEYV